MRALDRARHRVDSIMSGDGGTIEQGGAVIGDLAIGFDPLRSRRQAGRHDFGKRCRKRGEAHQAATFAGGSVALGRSSLTLRVTDEVSVRWNWEPRPS